MGGPPRGGLGGGGGGGGGGVGGAGSSPACSNGADDDGDGLIDFPVDPGCQSTDDGDETDEGNVTENGVILVPGLGFNGDWRFENGILVDNSGPIIDSFGNTISETIGVEEDAQAIARWDVVPYQRFGGSSDMVGNLFNLGIVAFHKVGINRLEFSLNGGPFLAVSEMTLNSRTDVYEYTVGVNASSVTDQMIEVRAIIYPFEGKPRVLSGAIDGTKLYDNIPGTERITIGEHSMFLYTNSNDTYTNSATLYVQPSNQQPVTDGSRDNPHRTIRQAFETMASDPARYEGSTIVLLEEGHYGVTNMRSGTLSGFEHWVTITSDPSINGKKVFLTYGIDQGTVYPDDVNYAYDPDVDGLFFYWDSWNLPIHSDLRGKLKRLKLQDIAVDFSRVSQFYTNYAVWLDDVLITKSKGWGDSNGGSSPFRTDYSGYYVTNSHSYDMIYGFTDAQLLRGSLIEKSSGDVVQNSKLVLNTEIYWLDGSILDHHTDVFQYFSGSCNGRVENVINYGVLAHRILGSQNILYDCAIYGISDLAFVNVFVENINDGPVQNQPAATDHLYFAHFGNPGVNWVWRERGTQVPELDGELQKNLFAVNAVFSDFDFPEQNMTNSQDVSNNHDTLNSTFRDELTIGTVYPTVNRERGAYGFVGPDDSLLEDSSREVVDLSYLEDSTPRKGPWSYFRPCEISSNPVSLIGSDPLKTGNNKFVFSGSEIDFYSGSYACVGSLQSEEWKDNGNVVGNGDTLSLQLDTADSALDFKEFHFNLPPTHYYDNGECFYYDLTDEQELEFSKLYIDPTGLFLEQFVMVTAFDGTGLPSPLSNARIYIIREIGSDYIRISPQNDLRPVYLKKESLGCGGDTNRIRINNATFSLRTVLVEEHAISLTAVDSSGRTDIHQKTIQVVNTEDPDLLVYMPFDGQYIDMSGRGNHLLLTNMEPTYGEGVNGNSLIFSETTNISYLQQTHFSELNGLEAVTIGVWVKRNLSDSDGKVFYAHPNKIALSFSDANTVTAGLATDDNTYGLSHTIVGDEEWHHYVVRYDGLFLSLWIDGQKVEEISASGPILTLTHVLALGADPWNSANQFTGMMDEFRFYDRDLSDAEINSIFMNSGGAPIGNLNYSPEGEGNGWAKLIDNLRRLVGWTTIERL